MAHRSQCSSAGDNPLHPDYLPPHYREEYRLAIDALIEADLDGYYGCLQKFNVVDFLSQPEIEYIKCTLLGPRETAQPDLTRYMTGDGDGSSDTYWPIHSDLDAPDLDLGWPPQHRFVGPTEIMTLVNPSDPEMPSIKENIRRMIKNAQQVVAVVMDMFTDVDIFADILNAAMRKVAVYVLLDEMNAHHFVAMANNCRVNLDEIKFLRVRTVSGSTYCCHTGKRFKGQMMNRFMLVDCRNVLSGNYSFTWSFEKIHRCLAHVFTGELVATFDEEFRILYAQSEMLVTETPMTYIEDCGNLPGRHDIEGSMRQYSPFEGICAGWPGYSFDDRIHVQPEIFRDESIRRSTDERLPLTAHLTHQIRGEPSSSDNSRLRVGLNTDVGFRMPGYTGIPDYSQISPAIRREQHIESAHYLNPEPGYNIYGTSTDQSYHNLAPFPGFEFPREMNDAVARGDNDHGQRHPHSGPAVESKPPGNSLLPVEAPPRRHSSIGQSYTCLTSPTQPNQPDQKGFFNFHRKQQDQKEGLRDWRISSYLTALQHSGQYDTAGLQRTDSYDNVPYAIQGRPFEPDISDTRQDNSEFPKAPTSKLNTLPIKPFDNLSLPEKSLDPLVDFNICPRTAKPTPPTTSESSNNTEGDKMEEMQNKEFVRTRPSLGFQRTSRLRNSLIFNSNLDQHTSEDIGNSLSQNNGATTLKHPSVISTLDKKRPVTREPFQWSSLGKSCDAASDSALKFDSDSLKDETAETDKAKITKTLQKESGQESSPSQSVQTQDAVKEHSQTTQLPSAVLQRSASFMDMNDPDCRLKYFKELAAKRKAELALANLSTKDKASKEPAVPKKSLPCQAVEKNDPASETPRIPLPATAMLPTSPKRSPDSKVLLELSSPKCASSCREIPASATDAEKIKLKQQLTEHSSSNTVEDKSASAANPAIHLNTKPKLTSHSSPSILLQIQSPEVTDSGVSSSPAVLQKPKNVKLALRDSISSQVATDVNAFLRPSSRKSTLITTDATATNTVHSLQLNATKTGFCATATETSLSKLLVPAETGPSQISALSGTSPSLHSAAAETGPLQYSAPVETSQYYIPAEIGHDEKIDTTQHSTSKGIGPYEHSAGSDFVEKTDTIQHTTAEQTGSSQHPTPGKTGSSDHLIAKETGPVQHPIAKEHQKSPSQLLNFTDLDEMTVTTPHLTAKKTSSSQHLTVGETGSSQPSAGKEICSSHHPIAEETDSSQHSTTKEIGSSQNPTANETVFSKNHIAKGSGPFQHSTAKETSNSHHSTSTGLDEKTDTTQHTTAKETSPSEELNSTVLAEKTVTQHTTAKETSPSQELNSTDLAEKTVTQHTTAKQASPSQEANSTVLAEKTVTQHTTAKETSPSQDPNQTDIAEKTVTQHTTAKQTSPSQELNSTDLAEKTVTHHTTAKQTSPSQELNSTDLAEKTVTQHTTAKETSPSEELNSTVLAEKTVTQHTTAKQTSPSQDPNQTDLAEKTVTQHTTAKQTSPSLGPNLTDLAKESFFSQHPIAEHSDSLQLLSAKEALPSNSADYTQHLTADPSEPSLHCNTNVVHTCPLAPSTQTQTTLDMTGENLASAVSISDPHTNSFTEASTEVKTDSNITSPPKTTSVSNTPSTTSVTNTILQPALLSPEGGVPRDRSPTLTETDPGTSTLQTGQSSGNTASDMSHSLPQTASLDIKPPNYSMSSKTDLCINETVTDSTPEAGVSQIVTLTIPCPGSNDLNPSPSPSVSADILSHSSSDVCQTVDLLVTEIQTAQDICETGSHSASNPSLSCDPKSEETKDEDEKRESTKEQTQQERLVDAVRHVAMEAPIDQVNKAKEATAHGANPGPSNLEQSQETQCCQHPGTDLANQQPPATEKHTHQSSTANVLSCSNLRDDTKVLLEQISAKNQGRASKIKEGDGTHVNTKSDNQVSSRLHSRPQNWSSKASSEEREKLLNRMASMRKEKKVYSRFEVP